MPIQLARKRAPSSPSLESGQIVECRGGTWRVLQENKGFWELELIKHGASFAEAPVRVWALPELEGSNIKVLDSDHALCPEPSKEQFQEGKLLRPMLAAHRSRVIHADERSKEATTAMGCAIDHKIWQFEPWKRIVEALPFPRLLIADDVGLGKTTEAAIILAELARRRRADRVMIVAPQHLTEKWQDELFSRFGLSFEIFTRETRERLSDRGITNPWEVVERVIVSRDFVKRWENFKPLSHVAWDMVVIDECHHFVRDDSGFSTRLRDFAEKIALQSPGLLLLSATPFTGSKDEFRSLLGLLDPKFNSKDVPWKASSPYMIRRLKRDVRSGGESFQDRKLQTIRITEKDLSVQEKKIYAAVDEFLKSQVSGASSAETWRHLQIETLRKRLSSSWHAFYETCADGEIAKWFDSSLIIKIKALIESRKIAKFEKVEAFLKSLHATAPGKKVVIFTEAIPTQLALLKYLTEESGYAVGAVRIIEGQTPREERMAIEDQFSNPESELRILIATDTLSEGKDLQHSCHHLIHFELPWSLVKIEQRNGRIDRLGQTQSPEIINVVLDLESTPDQRVLDRLTRKMNDAQQSLGSISPILENEQIRFEDLTDTASSLDRVIDVTTITKQLEELGIDSSLVTPLNPTPISHLDNGQERRVLFDLMLTRLGGRLEPNGRNRAEWLLALPEERWPLPELVVDSFGYPTAEKPWRVTFSPDHFLAYEKHLLKGGEARVPLQFLSPIHPVVQFTESRFRFLTSRKGYPVFSVRGGIVPVTVVAEFTLRSPKGRTIMQALEFLDFRSGERLDPAGYGDLVAGSGRGKLPSSAEWQRVTTMLQERLRVFGGEVGRTFDKRRRELLQEQNKLESNILGVDARGKWIEELWTLDEHQSQYQILALIVSEGRV